jgi:hypothetical protein
MWLFTLAGALAAEQKQEEKECLAVQAWVDRAVEDLSAADLDGARRSLDSGKASMACTPAEAEELAAWWQAEGAWRSLQGDKDGALRAFAASKVTAPEVWNPTLGPAMRLLYEESATGGPAALEMDTNRDRAVVDGVAVKVWPHPVLAGEHVVQVMGHYRGQVLGATLTRVQPGETMLVATGLPELPPPDRAEARRKRRPFLVAGASSAGLAVACTGTALWARAASGEAETIQAATNLKNLQLGAAYAMPGFAALGAAGLSIWAVAR